MSVYVLTIAVDYDEAQKKIPNLGTHRTVRDAFEKHGVKVLWSRSMAGCEDCGGRGWKRIGVADGCIGSSERCTTCNGTGR